MQLRFQAQHLSRKGHETGRNVHAPLRHSSLAPLPCPQVKERFPVKIFNSQIIWLKGVPWVFPEIARGPEWGCQSTSWDSNSERVGDNFPELQPPSSEPFLHFPLWGTSQGGGSEEGRKSLGLLFIHCPIILATASLYFFLNIKHINNIALFFFTGDNTLLWRKKFVASEGNMMFSFDFKLRGFGMHKISSLFLSDPVFHFPIFPLTEKAIIATLFWLASWFFLMKMWTISWRDYLARLSMESCSMPWVTKCSW